MLILTSGNPGPSKGELLFLVCAGKEPQHSAIVAAIGAYAKVVTVREEKVTHQAVVKAIEWVVGTGQHRVIIFGSVARAALGFAKGWSAAAVNLRRLFPDSLVSLGELVDGVSGLEIGLLFDAPTPTEEVRVDAEKALALEDAGSKGDTTPA